MTATWFIQGIFVGCLVAAGALAAEEVARLGRWQLRWIWIAALALTIALVGTASFRISPVLVTRAVVADGTPISAPSEQVTGYQSAAAMVTIVRTSVERVVHRSFDVVEESMPSALGRWILWLWISASASLLCLACVVQLHYWRARTHWPRLELHGTVVRLSPDDGPVVTGFYPPEIVIPQWLLGRSENEQRLVLAHETAHLCAGDPFVLAAGWVAVICMPWHPAVWWMASRVRLAVELDCDMRILRRGVTPRIYGEVLIDLAAQCSGLGGTAVTFAGRPTQLERRLLAIRPAGRRFAPFRRVCCALIALVAVVSACAARMPATNTIPSPRLLGSSAKSHEAIRLSTTGTPPTAESGRTLSLESQRPSIQPSAPRTTELPPVAPGIFIEPSQDISTPQAGKMAKEPRRMVTQFVVVDNGGIRMPQDTTDAETTPMNTRQDMGVVKQQIARFVEAFSKDSDNVSRDSLIGELKRSVVVLRRGSDAQVILVDDGRVAEPLDITGSQASDSLRILLTDGAANRLSNPAATIGVMRIVTPPRGPQP